MTRDFLGALEDARVPVVMEVKREDGRGTDLLGGRSVARAVALFEELGAPCLSVVTGRWFGGSPQLLQEVARRTALPLLRKDFLTRRQQLVQSGEMGASAVLLTATLLCPEVLGQLVETSLGLGLTPFVEVTTAAEARAVPFAERCVLAVNNKGIRDRERGAADLRLSLDLLPVLRGTGTSCAVSASGITTSAQAADLLGAGYSALLVGTALLGAAEPHAWVAGLERPPCGAP